ncbi:MAG: ATP-dependent DNA helicase RecG [Anaerosomatales bacterium]|nr:ATP-dependent DNA helicase RecG [Anaerosomatales bacterium]MDT8433425.1 ATP-dependent DNA helicase RecG [Anaerosomatales bacterium]
MPERIGRLTRWQRPVGEARFVDRARADALERLGVHTIGDLVRHFPFRYLDLSDVRPLVKALPGNEITVTGRVHKVTVKRPRPRLTIVEVAITDSTGILLGVWFNQPYMAERFQEGEHVAFAGRVEQEFGFLQMKNPFVERLGSAEAPSHLGRVLPIHRATEGLTTNWLRRLIAAAVDDVADVPDFLPVRLRIRHGLLSERLAVRAMHFPRDFAEASAARQRLAYDELLCLQLGLAARRHTITVERSGIAHVTDGPSLQQLRSAMPFALTADQTAAVAEILDDMASSRPANRMLLGDVGTGKTAVAAHALAAVDDTGTQAAMMAPTEVLAVQYAERVGPLLDEAGVSWALLTGSTGAKARTEILAGLESGDIRVLFGTHALIETAVHFRRLSLAIVDEQHRFGVVQRLALRQKGAAADMLVMTATPIPRSLALTRFGDLDTSYLRQRPHGDGEPRVTTRLVTKAHREEAYEEVRSAVRQGRQAYVVCALVDESDVLQARSANAEAKRLAREVFRDLRVGVLTGRMTSAERLDTMQRFRAAELDVLVATTVIEVGVDVPNATVMLIEDAERFGLAQLHQLRGRVGRGRYPGSVLLFADPKTAESRSRMKAVVSTTDGFVLAEEDLRLRGAGQLMGEAQHGLPELSVASLVDDVDLLDSARADAREIIAADPHLSAPEHAALGAEAKRRFAEGWTWVSSG